jgi:hypothetical protein
MKTLFNLTDNISIELIKYPIIVLKDETNYNLLSYVTSDSLTIKIFQDVATFLLVNHNGVVTSDEDLKKVFIAFGTRYDRPGLGLEAFNKTIDAGIRMPE